MKKMLLFALLLTGLTSFSQTDAVAGDYALTLGTVESNLFEYQLTLAPDGTFTFHYHSIINQGVPPEKHQYGKGKWTVENNVVSFTSDTPKEGDAKDALDFSNSKARFITKNPRDKTDQVVKTRLKFLQSDISWMKTINLLKL